MRTKDTLLNIGNISLLLQYLYINPEHRITFNNGITDLQLRMEADLSIKCKNLSFPDVSEMDWSPEMTPANCIAIIEILKEMPSVEFPAVFKNRWEEVRTITLANVSLNKK